MKLCRIVLFAYLDESVTESDGFNEGDLLNAIEYFEDLKADGFKEEPMDHIPVDPFISWATNRLNTTSSTHLHISLDTNPTS